MRDMVGVIAILGGIIEAIAAIGGPQLAGVGMETGQAAPPMGLGPLVVGLVVAGLSIVAGTLIIVGRSGQRLGISLIASSLVGAWFVGPSTGWFVIACAFSLLAGGLALFLRRSKRLGT